MARPDGGDVACARGPSRVYGPDMLVRVGLLVLAVSQLALAVWMVADPGSFFDHVGGFGARNDHYVRDVATWSAALAVVAFIAAFRESWQLPVLTFAALQFTLHAINHAVDANKAVASTDGVADAVELAIGALLLGALAVLSLRRRPTTH